MRIVLVFLLIGLAVVLAGLYGALYDQFTYAVSNEFFTKMRFAQEGIEGTTNTRWEVAKIGFVNTWHVGLGLGVFLTLAGLLHSDNRKMVRTTIQAFFMAVGMGFIFGLIAFFFVSSKENVATGIVDAQAFNKVLSMNNYSYVGSIIGMFLGLGWQILQTRLNKKK